jgi:hypothetical protein
MERELFILEILEISGAKRKIFLDHGMADNTESA